MVAMCVKKGRCVDLAGLWSLLTVVFWHCGLYMSSDDDAAGVSGMAAGQAWS